jgi:hypothetical protein
MPTEMIKKPEVIVVTLFNGDVALFVNTDAVMQLDASEAGSDPGMIGKYLAKALGVELQTFSIAVPSDPDWSWHDVYELLPTYAAILPEQPEHDLIEACKARYGDECPHYPVEDWTYLIASDGYRGGYWEWVRNKIESVFYEEVAEHFGLDESFQYDGHPDKILEYLDAYHNENRNGPAP